MAIKDGSSNDKSSLAQSFAFKIIINFKEQQCLYSPDRYTQLRVSPNETDFDYIKSC